MEGYGRRAHYDSLPMRNRLLRDAIEPLPRGIDEDVTRYAEFVEEVVYERAQEMDYTLTDVQQQRVVFLAGIFYLRDLVAGQHSLATMASEGPHVASDAGNTGVTGVAVGSEDVAPGSRYLRELARLQHDLNQRLRDAKVPAYVSSLSDTIRLLGSPG
jgi:hypothetical protein